jgi:hypothetical protein
MKMSNETLYIGILNKKKSVFYQKQNKKAKQVLSGCLVPVVGGEDKERVYGGNLLYTYM